VDPSSPNILSVPFVGDDVLAKLRRPFWTELESRFGNMFYVREAVSMRPCHSSINMLASFPIAAWLAGAHVYVCTCAETAGPTDVTPAAGAMSAAEHTIASHDSSKQQCASLHSSWMVTS
jgi:hypothetical protein